MIEEWIVIGFGIAIITIFTIMAAWTSSSPYPRFRATNVLRGQFLAKIPPPASQD